MKPPRMPVATNSRSSLDASGAYLRHGDAAGNHPVVLDMLGTIEEEAVIVGIVTRRSLQAVGTTIPSLQAGGPCRDWKKLRERLNDAATTHRNQTVSDLA